jgi:hypothetical protein
MFDLLANHSLENEKAEAVCLFVPGTAEQADLHSSSCPVHYPRVADAARTATLEYSDCVSRNYSYQKALQQIPPMQQPRACSKQVTGGNALRALSRCSTLPGANTVLNGRRARPDSGLRNFPECFALLRADECFGWTR